MLDKMREALLILGLCSRAKVDRHADQHLILWTLVRTDGVTQPVGQPPINDARVRFEIRCLGIPRRGPLCPCRCARRRSHTGCRSDKEDTKSNDEAKRFLHTLTYLPRNFGYCKIFMCKLLFYLPFLSLWLTISRTAPSLSSGISPRRRATS